MKRADIAMIVLIASISILVAFFATKALFGDNANTAVKVKTVDKINASITEPSTAIFNKDAINPTCKVNVGSGTTTTPACQ